MQKRRKVCCLSRERANYSAQPPPPTLLHEEIDRALTTAFVFACVCVAFEAAKRALALAKQKNKARSQGSTEPSTDVEATRPKFDRRERQREADEESDQNKVYVSRLPPSWTSEKLQRAFEEAFGPVEFAVVKWNEEEDYSRRFGFVTFASVEGFVKATAAGRLKKARNNIQIRELDRSERLGRGRDSGVCFAWREGRCVRGEVCRFSHEGPGGALERPADGKKQPKKCFLYRRGACTKGDACPFRHVGNPRPAREQGTRVCLDWKTKGKCRRSDTCKFAHPPEAAEKALKKKEARAEAAARKRKSGDCSADPADAKARAGKRNKKKRRRNDISCVVRVSGFPYDTTEADIARFFESVGSVVRMEIPRWADSGRSKGFASVEFENKQAAVAAVEKNGETLGGRWLDISSWKGPLLRENRVGAKTQ